MAEMAIMKKEQVEQQAVRAAKDPKDWATGDEPMTSRQRWFLKSLCERLDVTFDERLSKREASLKIERLRQRQAAAKPARKTAGSTVS